MLRLLRPKQWTKNLLLFAALVFARELFHPAAVATAVMAFVSFCLASSSVYVVNDILDAERDRRHREKRHRPIASGRVAPAVAWLLAAGLTGAGLALAAWIGWGFTAAVLVYLALSHFYSFVGKNIVLLDVLLVAIGFVLRAVAGALAIDVPYSDWFVLCTLFVALFIAVSKRKAELQAVGESHDSRPVLSSYKPAALAAYTGTSMAAAVISYSLYVQDVMRGSRDELRLMLFTVPVVILAIFRYYHLVEQDGAGEKPEDILLSDRPLQACILAFVVVAVVAFYARF